MTQAAKSILEALLRLSDTDREELVARLVASLDSGADENAEAEWNEEIRTRVEEVRTGQVKPVPWTTAREQIMDDSDGDG
jgi:putative addiction module component (TIGR02574 family)